MVGLRPSDPSPFWNPQLAKDRSMQDFLNAEGQSLFHDYPVDPLPQFDYLAKAEKYRQQAARIGARSAQNSFYNASQGGGSGGAENATDRFGGATPDNQFPNDNSPNVGPSGSGGTPRLRAVLRALAAQESGHNFGAVNSSSGALGAWQVLPSNIAGSGGWDSEALNRDITTSAFLHSPALQRAIVRYKFGNYLRQYGVRGALSAWYSGDPNAWRNDSPQSGGPSIHDYVMEVLARMGRH